MLLQRFKANGLIIFIFFLVLFLVFFPILSTQAARDGLELWLFRVLPALLPFMIAANLLKALGAVHFFGKILAPMMRLFNLPKNAGFAFALSFISGYPIGAKIIAEMHAEGHLSKENAQKCLGFMNNAGPLFILGAVSLMFGEVRVGYFILLINFVSAIILGLILGITSKKTTDLPPKIRRIEEKKPFGELFTKSAIDAIQSMLLIGTFIIIFSVISASISEMLAVEGVYYAVIAGIIEISNGINILSQTGTTRLTISLAAAIIAFGGLSISFQSAAFIQRANLSLKTYIIHKICHAALAFVLGFAVW